MVVVVVFPSEPVTAMMRHGQTVKKASISDVKKRSARFGRGELRRKGVKPRRAENHVLGDTGKVTIAQHKTAARRFQRCGLVLAERLARAFIAHRDGITSI